MLKVYKNQVDYVRSLPLHPSQQEIETADGYALFHYYLRPSFDFIQHLLWHREYLEVLSPISLRREIASILKEMSSYYSR